MIRVICLWCDVEFHAVDPQQVYCKKTHKNMASSARKRAANCPRPDKRSHPTREGAEIESARTGNAGLDPYQCRCGRWHIGHAPSVAVAMPKRIIAPRADK